MASLLQLVYVSSATAPLDDRGLEALLDECRAGNARHGVTGMLLYRDGNFLQLLEGEAAAVRALHARIERDPRHHHVITVLEEPAAERTCPDWSMGYVPASGLADAGLAAFTPFLLAGGDERRLRAIDGDVRTALETFRRNMR